MKNIEIFQNGEFGSIRSMLIDGIPWFIGKDIAEILGYKNISRDINRHVSQEDRQNYRNGTFETNRGMTIINESGLYSLILGSKLESAKRFKHWITSEVLPSIRKHGAYLTPETLQKALQNPDNLIQLLETLKDEQNKNKELQQVNAALTDKAHEWENKSVLNALIRSYAMKKCHGIFGNAWNEFYKNLSYHSHINLKIRKGKSQNPYKPMIDFLKNEEFSEALKIAVAMCEKAGIDIYKVINEVNYKKLGGL